MKERTFNSLMPLVNEQWSASLLNMEINPKKGPDLIDNEKAVEIKFKIIYPNERYSHKCWRVLGHQINYNKNYSEICWGLGFYKVNKEVKSIKRNELEKIVDYRELYLLNWDWINQFQIYHHKGKTNFSEWEYNMLFPKFSAFPKTILEKEVNNGKVFFTEGVNPERFKINSNPIYQKHKDTPF